MSAITSIFVISFIVIQLCSGAINEEFNNCSRLYNCGSIQGIGYPFWGSGRPDYCGSKGFELNCLDNKLTMIWIDDLNYRVLRIDSSGLTMTIAREDLWTDACPNFPKSTSLPGFTLKSDRTVQKLNIFYGCASEVVSTVRVHSNVSCPIAGAPSGVLYFDELVSGVAGCSFFIVVPILSTSYNDLVEGKITLGTALNQGFDVEYGAPLAACEACEASGGKCGSDSQSQFICICQDQSYKWTCRNRGNNLRGKLIIGVVVAGISISTCLVICYCKFRKYSNGSILLLLMRKNMDDQNLEAFIRQYESLTPRRYRYSDVKKMTNSFKEKLGQGGYGNVYKGYLSDSHPVAVKILKASEGSGEEFINEVATIGRTSHVNVVTLLGFCLDGHRRALIYEFLSNGSLEKYIHQESDALLGMEKLYEIAVGIARGLEYLHSGCRTRILHFDIKPHNILLDEDFCPKISDFGLAKLCTGKESIVSMLGARGTIGYIAPEVFSRNFGGVSYKSDVYSYGMMVLEMVARRKNAINVGMSTSSEAYFPQRLYHCVMLDEDLELQDRVLTKEENEIGRKMILVGLWCIQTNPLHRPSMSKVIDMLEGSLQSLEVPPKPFLSFPSRSETVSRAATVRPSKSTLSFASRTSSGSCTTSP